MLTLTFLDVCVLLFYADKNVDIQADLYLVKAATTFYGWSLCVCMHESKNKFILTALNHNKSFTGLQRPTSERKNKDSHGKTF